MTSRERPSLTLGSSPQRIRSYTRVFETLSRSATSSAVKQELFHGSFLSRGVEGQRDESPSTRVLRRRRAGEFSISGGEPALAEEAELIDHDGVLGDVERVSGPRGACETSRAVSRSRWYLRRTSRSVPRVVENRRDLLAK